MLRPNAEHEPSHDSVGARSFQRLDTLCDEFEAAWRRKERPSLEQYLARADETERSLLFRELLALELEYRNESGESCTFDEYAGRFPGWSEIVETLFNKRSNSAASGGEATVTAHAPTTVLRGAPQAPGYEVEGILGKGGMGVVYRARQLSLNRTVALKMISTASSSRGEGLERFLAEAETVARLQHPNIVQVFEVGQTDGTPFFSLELVAGGTLREHCAGEPLESQRACEMVETLARAVEYVHGHGIVHRDLKPANVLLTSDLVPKISDFGLAKFLGDANGQTQSGDILGTPSYMAPEQAAGKSHAAGPLADVYALGAILYELLTGKAPFRGATPVETIRMVLDDDPAPPSQLRPGLPRDVETICLKCLEKDPARRYASALALADDVRRFLNREPITARPVGSMERAGKWARRHPAVASLLAVIGIAAVAFVITVLLFTDRLIDESNKTRKALDDLRIETAAKDEATRAKGIEQKQKEDALRSALLQARTAGYVKTLGMADAAVRDWRIDQGRKFLDEAPDELRGWEWRYLNHRVQTGSRDLGKGDRIAWSPRGDLLAVVRKEETYYAVDLRETDTGRIRLTIQVTCMEIDAIAISPNSGWVAFGVEKAWNPEKKTYIKSAVWICDTHTGVREHVIDDAMGPVTVIAFRPFDTELAIGSKDGSIRRWNWKIPAKPIGIDLRKAPVRALAYSTDGNSLACAGDDGQVMVWDAGTYVQRHAKTVSTAPVLALAFRPDGNEIACAGQDGMLHLWNLEDATKSRTVPGDGKALGSLSYDPSGQQLAWAGSDGKVRVWRLDGPSNHIQFPDWKARKVSFHPRLPLLALAEFDARVVEMSPKSSMHDLKLETGSIRSAAISPDGTTLALGRGRQKSAVVDLFDMSQGKFLRNLSGHLDAMNCMAFHPDSNLLAVGDFAIHLWDLRSNKLLRRWYAHPLPTGKQVRAVNDLAFLSDGRRIVSCGGDNQIKIWDTDTGNQITLVDTPKTNTFCITASPDGKRFAAGSADKRVRIWDDQGRKLAEFRTEDLVLSVAFHPSGKQLAASSNNQWVLWDVESQTELLRGSTGKRTVESIAFSPDGRRLATLTTGGDPVRLWDTSTGQECYALHPVPGSSKKVLFSAAGDVVVMGNVFAKEQGQVYLFRSIQSPAPQHEAAVTQDYRVPRLKGFQNFLLLVQNDSGQPVKLHLRYMTRDAKDVWSPPGDGFVTIPLQAGERKLIENQGARILARAVRYWVETNQGELLVDRRGSDLSLTGGNDIILASEQPAYTLTIPLQ